MTEYPLSTPRSPATPEAIQYFKLTQYWLLRPVDLSEIHDVNVNPQPHVIGEVPADVIWIVINHDLVRIPEPVIAKAVIVWGNAKVEAAKPEALPVPSCKPKDMAGTETAREVPVGPRLIDMVVRIITAGVMPDPLFASIDVRGVRVPGLFAIIAVFRGGAPCTSNRSRPMRWNVVPTSFTLGVSAALGLCKSRNGKDQQRHEKSHKLLSCSPPRIIYRMFVMNDNHVNASGATLSPTPSATHGQRQCG